MKLLKVLSIVLVFIVLLSSCMTTPSNSENHKVQATAYSPYYGRNNDLPQKKLLPDTIVTPSAIKITSITRSVVIDNDCGGKIFSTEALDISYVLEICYNDFQGKQVSVSFNLHGKDCTVETNTNSYSSSGYHLQRILEFISSKNHQLKCYHVHLSGGIFNLLSYANPVKEKSHEDGITIEFAEKPYIVFCQKIISESNTNMETISKEGWSMFSKHFIFSSGKIEKRQN